MMSMSGGWFFVVASEALTVGHTSLALPGIGSYIAEAIAERNLVAIGWAIVAMLVVIVLYDQLLFRPLVAWADRLKFEQDSTGRPPTSWALTVMMRSRLLSLLSDGFFAAVRWSSSKLPIAKSGAGRAGAAPDNTLRDRLFLVLLIAVVVLGLWHIGANLIANTTVSEALQVCGLSLITMVRVFVFIAIASLIWVPIGVWVGLRPQVVAVVQPVAQFMAAFPAQLLFPFVVSFIVRWKLTPDIWLSPLMILGTQWYILFNVIAGASAIPGELQYAAQNFNLRGWQWWKDARPAGGIPLLRDRCHHRLGRLVERGLRGRIHQLGDNPGQGPWHRCLPRRGQRSRGLPRHRVGHRGPCRCSWSSSTAFSGVPCTITQNDATARLRTAMNTAPLLQVKDVCKAFPKPDGEGQHIVLEGVNLTVNEGEIVGLLGRSGSGKSTLLRCIAGLSSPTGGDALLPGCAHRRPRAGHLDGVPELRHLPVAHGLRECGIGPGSPACLTAGGSAPRPGGHRPDRPRRL